MLRSNQLEQYPLSDWYLGALRTLSDRQHPDRLGQASNSLREILECLPKTTGAQIKEIRPHVFQQARQKIADGMEACKKFYPNGWEGQVVEELVEMLALVDEYLDLNDGPDRQERTADGILQSNPIRAYGSQERRNLIATELTQCGKVFQGFTHHHRDAGGEFEFSAALVKFEKLLLEVFKPSAVEVQRAIREIVKVDPRSLEKKKLDKILKQVVEGEANEEFFFRNLKSAAWAAPLNERGFFSSPPPMKKVGEGYIQFPSWLPLLYLASIAGEIPQLALEICLKIPKTNNARVYAEILKVAISINKPELSVGLASKILEGTHLRFYPFDDGYGGLIAHWSASDASVDAAIKLAGNLLPFQPDPLESEKTARRTADPAAWDTILEPKPKFESWGYQRIMDDGVGPLILNAPLKTAAMLCSVLAGYLDLKFRGEDLYERRQWDDHSQVWCRRIAGFTGEHVEQNRALVHAVTAASEEICRRANQVEVSLLDEALSEGKWKIFTRIRHYLYARYPALFRDQIRRDILGFREYGERDYGRERADMIQSAARHFGTDLLAPEELKPIVAAILAGPDYESFKKFMAEEFTENAFTLRRNYFHRQQLWPFEAILSGEALVRLEEAKAAVQGNPGLGTYSPTEDEGGREMVSESPVPEEELTKMPDSDLISFINEWDRRLGVPDKWWVTIDQLGLVGAFLRCVEKSPERFAAWIEQWSLIARPIYLRGVIDLGTRQVEAKNFSQLDTWLRVCQTVLNKPVPLEVDPKELSEESADKPRWERARSGVESFLKTCLKEKSEFPLGQVAVVTDLLEQLCLGPDTTLDQPDSIYQVSNDPISTAINTTRGRGLELMQQFVFWLKPKDPLQSEQVKARYIAMLERRLTSGPPLSAPERALLALHYGNLLATNEIWAKAHFRRLFPRNPFEDWLLTFGNLLRYTHARGWMFESFREEYVFALANLESLRAADGDRSQARESAVDSLGLHLFFYYLWGQFSLDGPDGLLGRFLAQASVKERETLLRHAGASIEKSPELEEKTRLRAQAFLENRIAVAEAGSPTEEFGGLYGWLKTHHFPAEWRLTCFLRLLNLGISVQAASLYVECLHAMLPDNLALIMACFAKICEQAKDPNFYIDPSEGKPLLRAGLKSTDEAIRSLALKAQENLVDAGRSEYLDE